MCVCVGGGGGRGGVEGEWCYENANGFDLPVAALWPFDISDGSV